MDRTQLYAIFDTVMARETYSIVMGGDFSLTQRSLESLATSKSERVISSVGFINGWDLFESCIEAIIVSLQIPQSHGLAGRITDAIAEEIDICDYIPSGQPRVLGDILEYVGLDPYDDLRSKDMLEKLLDLVHLWGGCVTSSANMFSIN